MLNDQNEYYSIRLDEFAGVKSFYAHALILLHVLLEDKQRFKFGGI